MKFSILSTGLALLAQLASAVPIPTEVGDVVERANIGKRPTIIIDVATTGFATQNCETSGGADGATTTVSTLAQFTDAVTNDEFKRVIAVPFLVLLKSELNQQDDYWVSSSNIQLHTRQNQSFVVFSFHWNRSFHKQIHKRHCTKHH
ncbi:hypothetical protein OCU04_008778 [Sclerotinia nivalis]|uniref:Uncharacterized protein n=1 Tax=Sclerotinia nivalis TaxID=352851 RepID=A0A9X0AG68_9HELO|nr:hypothetical protein OCU04_008778 [Sclerotinia nivalis]